MPATLFSGTSLALLMIPITVTAYWVIMETLATTVGVHRLFTHRSFDTTRRVATYWLWWVRSGGVKYWEWVWTHLWHHAHVDTDLDSYTPNATNRITGRKPLLPFRKLKFWDNAGSYMSWSNVLNEHPEMLDELASKDVNVRRSLDFMSQFDDVREKYGRTLKALYFNLAIFTAVALPFCLYNFGWLGFFAAPIMGWAAIGVKVMLYLVGGYIINRLGHMKQEAPHHSDIPKWLMFITFWMMGEAWHEFHHDAAWAARFHRRWDPGWWVISLLRRFRLAWNIRIAVPTGPRCYQPMIVSAK